MSVHNCLLTLKELLRYVHTLFIFIAIELTIQFSNYTYIGSERSGMIPVTLVLGGGISMNKITMTVMPSDQSPVSAEGKKYLSSYD